MAPNFPKGGLALLRDSSHAQFDFCRTRGDARHHSSWGTRVHLRVTLTRLCVAVAVASAAPVTAQEANAPLVRRPHYTEVGEDRWWTVIDSRWGYVSRFNLALADRLAACAGEEPASQAAILRLAPNRFGAVAEESLRLLGTCEPRAVGNWRAGQPVTVALWRTIAPLSPLPTTIEKARAVTFRGSGIAYDYDVAYWTADAPREAAEPLREIFIWGPSRASVVDGCFVQRIVRSLDESPAGREVLERSFLEIPAGLAALRSRTCPANLATVQDETNRRQFRLALTRLGSTALGRQAYDSAYLGVGGPWAGKINRLYRIYQAADLRPTETDFAMFLELARGSLLPEARVGPIGRGLKKASPETPAQARRILASLLAPAGVATRDYELGRAVSYYIDGIGAANLSAEELGAWQRHSRLKASDVGLGEQAYLPCDMVQGIPGCASAGGGS